MLNIICSDRLQEIDLFNHWKIDLLLAGEISNIFTTMADVSLLEVKTYAYLIFNFGRF